MRRNDLTTGNLATDSLITENLVTNDLITDMTGDGQTGHKIDHQTGHKTGHKSGRVTTGLMPGPTSSLTPYGMSFWALILAACGGGGPTTPTTSGPTPTPAAPLPSREPGFPRGWEHVNYRDKDDQPITGDIKEQKEQHYSYAVAEGAEKVAIDVAALMQRQGLDGDVADYDIEILPQLIWPRNLQGNNSNLSNTDGPPREGFVGLELLGEGENRYLRFVRDGNPVAVDFETPDDVSGNNVFYLRIRFTDRRPPDPDKGPPRPPDVPPPLPEPTDVVLHISIQNVVEEGEDVPATFIANYFGEDGRSLVEDDPQYGPTMSVADSTTAVQSLKAKTLGALFGIDIQDDTRTGLAVMSGKELVLKVSDADGGNEAIYMFSLRSANVRETDDGFEAKQDRFNKVEFADKGRDSGGDEIIDIQYTAAMQERLANGTETGFRLYARKLNADGTVDESWGSHGWDHGHRFRVIYSSPAEAPSVSDTGVATGLGLDYQPYEPEGFDPLVHEFG